MESPAPGEGPDFHSCRRSRGAEVDRVFISYRRDDTAREAHVLKVLLEERLADVAVFIDNDDVPGGADWPQMLRNEVERASAVLALIGPDWRQGAGDVDRLSDAGDWVREELALALSTKPGRLLPVLVEDATDQLSGLPAEVERLTHIQRKTLNAARWLDDVHAIVSWVSDTLGADSRNHGVAFPKPDEVKQLFPPLNPADIDRLLNSGGLSRWTTRSIAVPGHADAGIELHKVFEFTNFRRAFHFMRLVAIKADEMNHHPEWSNVYNSVVVGQRTWDGGHVLTPLDFQMAAYMNRASADVIAMPDAPWPP